MRRGVQIRERNVRDVETQDARYDGASGQPALSGYEQWRDGGVTSRTRRSRIVREVESGLCPRVPVCDVPVGWAQARRSGGGVKLEIESRRGSLVRVDVAVNEARLRGHLPRGNKLAAKVANEHTS